MARWTMPANQSDQRAEISFSGGLNVGNPTLDINEDECIDAFGWDTDSFPALHTHKNQTAWGTSGAAQTNLLVNFGQTELVRAVGTALQHDSGIGTWSAITGTFTDTDWDATNFEVSAAAALILTNGTDNVKYWNGSALADLNAANAPKGKYITNDISRVWIAKDDILYFSAFQAPTDWTSAENSGSVQYFTSNGGFITGLRNFYGDKYVWKKDSMAVIQGTNYFNFRLREISNDVGCVSFKTIQEVGDSLFWLGQNDVYQFKGGLPVPIGQRIRKYLDSINVAQLSRCFGATDGIRYFLGLVTGANTQPDTFLVYDPRYGKGHVRSLNNNFRYSANLNNVWYIGDSVGQTYKMNQGYSTATAWMITTKDFTERAQEIEKEYWELHLQIYAPSGTTLTVYASADQGTTYTQIGDPITTAAIDQNMPVIIPLDTVPLARWMRFKIQGTGEVKLYRAQRRFRLQPVQW